MPPSDERLYEFVRRDRHTGYIDTDLWLPKSAINPDVVRASLTFRLTGLKGGEVCLYNETDYHAIVPRHYLAGQVPWFDLVDLRPSFDIVQFQDRVTPRDPIQEEAWKALSRATHGVLNLACGRGKTALALKKIALAGVPALVVVYQTGTIAQWAKEAEAFLGVTPTVIQGPTRNWQDSPLVIASISTLMQDTLEWPLEMRARFGLVVFDECHHMSAPVMGTVGNMFFGNRLGLTATPKRDDGAEVVYYNHIGPIFYSNTTQDLTPVVCFHQLDTELDLGKCKDRAGELSTPRVYAALGAIDARNDEIANHIVRAHNRGRRILALGHSLVGLHALHERVQAKLPGVDVGLITGKTKQSARFPIFQRCPVVIATTSIASEALDAPHLDTVMFTTLFRGERMLVQGLGRMLRPKPGKQMPVATFFEDTRVGPCRGWARALRTALSREGIDVRITQ